MANSIPTNNFFYLFRISTFALETRVRAKAPLRCIDIDPTTSFVAVGLGRGAITLYYMDKQQKAAAVQGSLLRQDTGQYFLVHLAAPACIINHVCRFVVGPSFTFQELDSRKDCLEDISGLSSSYLMYTKTVQVQEFC